MIALHQLISVALAWSTTAVVESCQSNADQLMYVHYGIFCRNCFPCFTLPCSSEIVSYSLFCHISIKLIRLRSMNAMISISMTFFVLIKCRVPLNIKFFTMSIVGETIQFYNLLRCNQQWQKKILARERSSPLNCWARFSNTGYVFLQFPQNGE